MRYLDPSSAGGARATKTCRHRQATLTQQEAEAFDSFVSQCVEEGLLPSNDGPLQDKDRGVRDETAILRFLSGNNFHVENAFAQFKTTVAIREAIDADSSYEEIDISRFEEARSLYPHWSGRRDKFGCPICYLDIGKIDVDKYNKSIETAPAAKGATAAFGTRDAIAVHDYLTKFVVPACSAMTDRKDSEKGVTSVVLVVDVSGLTFTRVWRLRTFIQNAGQLLAICYPELLHKVYLLNSTPLFDAIWGMAKKWLHPNTASKVELVPQRDILSTLMSVIDEVDIPRQYGGSLDFEHGLVPKVDDAFEETWAPASSIQNELPAGPIKLATIEGKKMLVVTGTMNGSQQQDPIRSFAHWEDDGRGTRASRFDDAVTRRR